MTVYTMTASPLGELMLVGEVRPTGTALRSVSIAGGKTVAVQPEWIESHEAFAAAIEQLGDYFAGRRTRFDLDCAVEGSEFRRRVWQALDDIPYGRTVSYGEIGARIGAPRAALRAVGAAIGANPVLIVRPCHRVIGADGRLTGYAGGLERKRQLLELEHAA
ncbi:methylated-DNA--[protein]-cysteine S-methyltransferase [Nocardia spumae]|uniref:methylated-DNA--[protein]-cysteine S-methyltransferase n=1 Tax=Nocardia spumae TaxID=2887190 RepID=UPI001D15A6D2|nr:methylated-DNA--[protein]-cysteine S-methyltransferase [Nocardia spumae]